MKPVPRLTALSAVLVLVAPAAGAEWTFDGSKPLLLRTKFGNYGWHPTQAVRPEAGSLRLWLPAREGVGQTGIYSLFALAGDCEVIVTFELLKLQSPRTGYGSGIGLSFDVGEGGEEGRGTMQRVEKPGEGNGHVVQTNLPGAKEEYRFQWNSSRSGRIGLRRVKKELIFLASDTPTGELQEIERLPFTDQTIRKVRLFADPGGSPTALDARIRRIEVRAEEMTGGTPEIQPETPTRWWLWVALGAVCAGGVFWFWQARRRQ